MRFSGQPSSRAISMRTNDGLCEAVWMVSDDSRGSATDTNGSSGVCITCWVRKVCSNTWSAAASARSASPRRRWKSSATLVFVRPLRCLRSGKVPAGFSTSWTIAFEVIASTSSKTAGSSSYSATIRCAASSATCGSDASTTATGSPTWRTLSMARIGWSWKAGP